MEPVALLFGFEPFGGDDINPSQRIVESLDGERIAGHRVVARTLPTEFGRAVDVLSETIDAHAASLVLALGQAGGRIGMSIERIAINLIDARIADNAGNQPIDEPVIDGAPNAYFSTLPIKAMLHALHGQRIPASISNTAGTFVCNQVFYALAHLIATRHPTLRGGFIHVPYLPEQARQKGDAPWLDLETMVAATRLCLRVALTTQDDLHVAAGATH